MIDQKKREPEYIEILELYRNAVLYEGRTLIENMGTAGLMLKAEFEGELELSDDDKRKMLGILERNHKVFVGRIHQPIEKEREYFGLE